jgi:sugar-specific transcriptional regulator TrmB
MNCILKHIIEGEIEGRIEATERRGRRHKKLLHDLQETRGYCKLKEEALVRNVRRNRFGRGYGAVVRKIREIINEGRKERTNQSYQIMLGYNKHIKLYMPQQP